MSSPNSYESGEYTINIPILTPEEQDLIDTVVMSYLYITSPSQLQQIYLKDKRKGEVINRFREKIHPKLRNGPLSKEELTELEKSIESFVETVLPQSKNKMQVAQYLFNILTGPGKLYPLLEDQELEEIMVNGVHRPVYVFHRKKGMCKTNIVIDSIDELLLIIKRLANTGGKIIDSDHPIVDFSLPDGSRVNATIPPVSVYPTLTIRKFYLEPMTLPQLISNNTISYELAAFLWLAVEGMHINPMNMLVVGGSGSGKTTTLNALAALIPTSQRIITVEDTLELNLENRDNWIQLCTYYDYVKKKEITMNDLLRTSLRMRPDRVIVGEVRGKEAETLFVAMDIGCSGSMGTLHANNAREALIRLQSPPMEVPEGMLPLLDIIIVQHRFNWPGKGLIRRVTSVSEVGFMGDKITLNEIFSWDKKRDRIVRETTPSQILDKLAYKCGLTKNEIIEEMRLRETLFRLAVDENFSNHDFSRFIHSFYTHREEFLKKMEGTL